MKAHSFFSRVFRSPIPRHATVLLVAVAWSNLAVCGEIHDAAKSGDLEKVRKLIKGNPDLVFSKDKNDATPLHAAALQGYNDIAELLLANKPNVNATNYNGDTPLHFASLNGHKAVAKLLLAHNADVNAIDNHGETPLHWAVLRGNKDMAEFLLANKANVDAKDKGGTTPILLAANNGYKALEEMLSLHGANKSGAGTASSVSPGGSATQPAAGRAKTARIIVEPARIDGQIIMAPPDYKEAANSLPFARDVKRALLNAGYSVGETDQGPYELIIRVKPDVSCENHGYNPPRWTKAEVKGQIVLSTNDITAGTAQFDGVADPTVIIIDNRQFASPGDAPFQEAFNNSHFTEVVTRVIASVPSVPTISTGDSNKSTTPATAKTYESLIDAGRCTKILSNLTSMVIRAVAANLESPFRDLPSDASLGMHMLRQCGYKPGSQLHKGDLAILMRAHRFTSECIAKGWISKNGDKKGEIADVDAASKYLRKTFSEDEILLLESELLSEKTGDITNRVSLLRRAGLEKPD